MAKTKEEKNPQRSHQAIEVRLMSRSNCQGTNPQDETRLAAWHLQRPHSSPVLLVLLSPHHCAYF